MGEGDDRILRLIDALDREAVAAGATPRQRPLRVIPKVCAELGIVYVLGRFSDPRIETISAIHNSFFRPDDLAVGSVFTGITRHLDLFFRVDVPWLLGTVRLDYIKHIDIKKSQLRRVFQVEAEVKSLCAGICDVFDIGFALGRIGGFNLQEGDATDWFSMAAFHAQAAAITLRHAYDFRGAVQSALLCAELAVKSALIFAGRDADYCAKNIGHNLEKALPDLRLTCRYPDIEVESIISGLPHFVRSRYIHKNWNRTEAGDIVSAAQRLLALVVKANTGRSNRDHFPADFFAEV